MTKTVPISVRVSNEDAEFLTKLKIENAITPSDKVRSLIKEARQQKELGVTYEGCLSIARDMLQDLVQKVKAIEVQEKQHSELVNVFNEWVAECFAYIVSAKHKIDADQIKLKQLEEGISERVFRLFEVVARMGVTSQEPCYNKKIILAGFLPILELIQIINQRIEKEKTK